MSKSGHKHDKIGFETVQIVEDMVKCVKTYHFTPYTTRILAFSSPLSQINFPYVTQLSFKSLPYCSKDQFSSSSETRYAVRIHEDILYDVLKSLIINFLHDQKQLCEVSSIAIDLDDYNLLKYSIFDKML
ncbi:MAG: hypothetical protein M3P08_08405 [Thermoproteota archaeon]|nr:hypothetical protein [Thermoproteota archaeon]